METMNNEKIGTATSQPSRLPQLKSRVPRRVLIVAALLAPCVVLAEEPGPDAATLARADALFAYCAKIDPAHGARYREQLELASQGATQEAITKVRQSEDYQQVHKSVEDLMALLDENNSVKVCNSALPQN